MVGFDAWVSQMYEENCEEREAWGFRATSKAEYFENNKEWLEEEYFASRKWIDGEWK